MCPKLCQNSAANRQSCSKIIDKMMLVRGSPCKNNAQMMLPEGSPTLTLSKMLLSLSSSLIKLCYNNKKISYKITETEYERPVMTYTDKLSKSQIQELLVDYEQVKNVEELMKIPIGTHLRYFDNKNNLMKFRTGGILTVNSGLPEYLI